MKLRIGLPNTVAHEADRRLMLEWARLAEEAQPGSTSSGRPTSRTTTRGIRRREDSGARKRRCRCDDREEADDDGEDAHLPSVGVPCEGFLIVVLMER
jgi:hypothetical protein